MAFLDETGLARLWSKIKAKDEAIEDEIDALKSKLNGATVYKNLTPQTSYANFNDGSTLPLISLTSNIEPIQDLHGYDNPWVGGAGKNIALVDAETTQKPSYYDGSWSIGGLYGENGFVANKSNGDGGGGGFALPIKSGSYVVSFEAEQGKATTETYRMIMLGYDSTYSRIGDTISTTTSGNSGKYFFTVSLVEGTAFAVVRIVPNSWASGVTHTAWINKIQIESGSTATSFEPYSNICPISGHTEANVVVSPLNISQLYNGQIYGDGSWVENSARLTNVQTAQSNVYFLKAGTYTLDFDMLNPSAPTLKQCSLLTKDSNFNIVENLANAWNSLPFTFTLTQDGYLYFTVRRNGDTIINPSDYRVKILGQSYNVEFKDGSNPLTVYGGTLDVVSGKLVVKPNRYDLSDLNWVYASTQKVFYCNLPTDALNVTNKNGICEGYKPTSLETISESTWSHLSNGEFVFSANLMTSGRCALVIKDLNYTDATTFKSAVDDIHILYPLATPQTYQLTPTQVNSLLGQNYISSDTGNITNVKYLGILNLS